MSQSVASKKRKDASDDYNIVLVDNMNKKICASQALAAVQQKQNAEQKSRFDSLVERLNRRLVICLPLHYTPGSFTETLADGEFNTDTMINIIGQALVERNPDYIVNWEIIPVATASDRTCKAIVVTAVKRHECKHCHGKSNC